ncbi:hypothetical protein LAZ67_2006363 [Cordylochernes scorpioides]|uniref:CCHC-type domain-containing protein n=1 Tax=Cordylochernes scorpioides TaxID=51811 RepID=A0ABY6K600_9ARAC|nr:hypothetical protein LAZ67_2006363 [Cordylochernes scorpioides]
MSKDSANVAPAESPEGALQMHERLSSNCGALAENSAKEALAIDSSEINEKTAGYANLPASNNHANPAPERGVTAPMSSTGANQAPRSWAETMEVEDGPEDDFSIVRNKKRRRGSMLSEHPAAQHSSARRPDNSQPRKRPTGLRTMQVQEVKATRANIADARARQASSNQDNYVFIEHCPDFAPYQYLQSVDKLIGGPKNIVQFNRMNGHVLVGLSSKAFTDRLIDQGLEIEGTTLVEDAAIIEALRPYGRVTSIAPIQIKMGEYTFTDGRREAYILLHEGMKLDKLPTHLDLKSKGDSLPAFLSFGIKCSKCGKQGHRRANCPTLARRNIDPKRPASLSQHSSKKRTPTISMAPKTSALGYNAVVEPPDAILGSGLACLFALGVTVSRHRVLWPGHIALVDLDVHGQEMTFIYDHLSHNPRERVEQLGVIEVAAVQEEAWVLGYFNVREDRNRDSLTMGALRALHESAALFDAAHLPTRVAGHGDRIERSRLDRILVPARFLERTTSYATTFYNLSDHRMVLLRVGPPAAPSQPRVAAMLRSGLVLEHLNTYLVEIEEDLSQLDASQLWDRWSLIKAGLLAEARSLHILRHYTCDDSYIGRTQRLIREQLDASSINADYLSLPDRARLVRHRRPAVTIRNEDGAVFDGPELRRRRYDIFQPRFARAACDSTAGAAFIEGTTDEDDPLHREDITLAEIAAAISRLPSGRAPGWDGLPCELLVAFVGFFAGALSPVFTASHFSGALPPSTRRSSICLFPKTRGGRGFSGYRPILLPSDDYRVLGLPSGFGHSCEFREECRPLRPVTLGGLGLLDIGAQLHLACLKGVQAALRGRKNDFSWLVLGGVWLRPHPDGTPFWPRRLWLLRLWEEASKILGLDNRAVPTSQLLELPNIGGCRFLRPPNLLAPARWSGVRVADLRDAPDIRPTRSSLADAAALVAFCRRTLEENLRESTRAASLAEALVLRGTNTPFSRLTTRSARRALERPRLAAQPITRLLSRWTSVVDAPARLD